MSWVLLIGFFVIGALMGSFACCTARRQSGGLTGKLRGRRRSACASCGKQLAARDLIPILSWVGLKGKCRYCKKLIGKREVLAELGLGLAFAASYLFWPWALEGWGAWAGLIVFLVSLVTMTVLFITDLFEHELSTMLLMLNIICACAWTGIMLATNAVGANLWSRLGAVAILAGVYLALYLVSKGKKASGKKYGQLVGDGDWLLALGLAIFLGDWWLALLVLTGANALGSLVAIPMLMSGRAKTGTAIPFGPFLMVAFLVVFLMQTWLLGFAAF
ncbi:prepilin peptidase [Candidatus Saccharibacteria bacterium]|nr:prepilin peptidase [Candidatus Saccharibacteria bacterium]